ncbi:PAS domain S-box-containing protein [Methanocalculus alkaliphilus]|uniref:PAS domain S-box protein n=1 Tax=Methanocalculus alkaliphilus TaxID=768730 RepID=UPI00209F9167|nr:PAS domain S-box protein [Methanocalculus alkaliphilus]MCP1716137.1 PAS domain S-box-containing protein [Methanocalculus alkaliphilus]
MQPRQEDEHDMQARVLRGLHFRPKGMTITEVARRIGATRNSVSKHLEILRIAGRVEMRSIGNAKLYSVARRVPLSAFLCFTKNLILVLDSEKRIVHANDLFVKTFVPSMEEVIGLSIHDAALPLITSPEGLAMIERNGTDEHSTTDLRFKKDSEELFFQMQVIPTTFDDGEKGITIILEDITERKRMEEDLRESEERYRNIVEDQTEFICRFRPDGRYLFVNGAYCRYFGLDRDDILEHGYHPEIPPEDRERLRTFFTSLTERTPFGIIQHRIIMPDGSVRWQEWSDRAIFDSSGKVTEYQSVGRDITIQKEAEEALFQQSAALSILNEIIITANRCQSMEKILETLLTMTIQLLSYDAGGIYLIDPGGDTASVVHSYNLPQEFLTHVRTIGIRSPPASTLFLKGDPLITDAYSDTCPVHGPLSGFSSVVCVPLVAGGSVIGALNVASRTKKRVTPHEEQILLSIGRELGAAINRMIAEDRLRKSERLFREIVDLSPFPTAIIDAGGRYLFVNRQFTRTFGYIPEDIPTGKEWFEKAFPDPETRRGVIASWKADREQIRQGEVRPRTYPVRCKNGDTRMILFQPVELSDGTEYVTYTDVTEDRAAYRILLGEIASLQQRRSLEEGSDDPI